MLSQTIEYALRAMSHLAGAGSEPASCESIARATGVPRSYLAKIMRDLVNAKLLNSIRGPRGGFLLARGAAEISVLEIINAVDPIRRIARCPLDDTQHAERCPLHQCLDDAVAQIEQTFGRATLATIRSTGQCHWTWLPAQPSQGDCP